MASGLLFLGLAGCGQGSSIGSPTLPLVAGAKVVKQVRRCDEGNHVFCAIELVVADGDFRSAGDFLITERRYLRGLGWSLQQGEIGQERSAVSPARKFRMIYATAAGDLLAIDLGWIQRPPSIALALSRTLFNGTPAISLMLEAGPA